MVKIVAFNLALQLLVKAVERCCLAAENACDIHSSAMKFPISSCPIETAETCILASPGQLVFLQPEALTSGGRAI